MIKKILFFILLPSLLWASGISFTGISNPAYTAYAASSTRFKFVVMSDNHARSDLATNLGIMDNAIAAIIALDPEVVIVAGDLIEGYNSDPDDSETEYATWLDHADDLWTAGITVYATRGNHCAVSNDYSTPLAGGVAAWNNVFTGAYAMPQTGPEGEEGVTYAVTHKNATFVMVDQFATGTQFRVNQTWLDATLPTLTTTHIFVVGHGPAFQVVNWGSGLMQGSGAATRTTFWQSLESANVDALFSGHLHTMDASLITGGSPQIYQFIDGSCGGIDVSSVLTWATGFTTANSPYDFHRFYNWHKDGTSSISNTAWRGIGFYLVEVDGEDVTVSWYHYNSSDGTFYKTAFDTVFTHNAQE